MLLIKKKPKKKTFITADITADIKDEKEAIEIYSEQVQELDDEGNYAEADKINHILGQEKQHKKILVGIKKSEKIDYSKRLKDLKARRTGVVVKKPSKADRYAYKTNEKNPIYIPVNRILTPYQTDATINETKVKENVKKIKRGESMPPLVIGYNYDLHDGHHRLEAAKECNNTHVPCVVGGMNEKRVKAAEKRYRKLWKSKIEVLISGGKLLLKKISGALGHKLTAGNAHWVTVKNGPLEGRHLLIEGARPSSGQSKGKILAGKGIPLHVIKKITGATHAHHLDHASTRFGDVSGWNDKMYESTISGLKEEIKEKVADKIKWMKASGGKGVEQGGIGRNEHGEVVTRWGRTSLNPKWYQDLHRRVGHTPTGADYKRLALDHLENGYMDHEANHWIEPDKDYIQSKTDIEDLNTLKSIKSPHKKQNVGLVAKSAYIMDGRLLLKVR